MLTEGYIIYVRRHNSILKAHIAAALPSSYLTGGTCQNHNTNSVQAYSSKHATSTQCCTNVGPASWTVGQHCYNIGSMSRVC